MDKETAETVAAYGGLLLGLINLGQVIYRDHIRKPTLNIKIEESWVKWGDVGSYLIQANISFTALHGDIYLREIELSNLKCDYAFVEHTHRIPVPSLVEHVSENLTDVNIDEFVVVMDNLHKSGASVRNLKIGVGETRSMTILTGFHTARLQDGWTDFPTKEWDLSVHYGEDKSIDTLISFQVTGENNGRYAW